jgi:hypothetical protein
VLKAVASTGSLGWLGGGQTLYCALAILKALINPAKIITSTTTKISIARTAFGNIG